MRIGKMSAFFVLILLTVCLSIAVGRQTAPSISDKTSEVANVTPDIIASLKQEIQEQTQKYDDDIQGLREQIKAMKNDNKQMNENYKTQIEAIRNDNTAIRRQNEVILNEKQDMKINNNQIIRQYEVIQDENGEIKSKLEVVRSEFGAIKKVNEILQADIDLLHSHNRRLQDDIADLQTNNEQLQADIDGLKIHNQINIYGDAHDIGENQISIHGDVLAERLAHDNGEDATRGHPDLYANITDNNRESSVGIVAFQARSQGFTGLSGVQIPFELVDINIGNAYDPSGTFTAPVSGLYQISYEVLADNSCGEVHACARLHQNGVYLMESCSEVYASAGSSMILQLMVGDDVYLDIGVSCFNLYPGSGSFAHNQFSGHLLYEIIP